MLLAFAGLVAGASHVLCGPDHLTAVAPFAVRERRTAWLTGLKWGMGHATGILLMGTLLMLLREKLPVDAISSWSEYLAGVVLIVIGIWALRRAFSHQLHCHEHSHEGQPHLHFHLHPVNHKHAEEHVHRHTLFGIGVLHGLAGSAHFIGILPVLGVVTRVDSIAYILAFGLGTMITMALFSSMIGILSRRFALEGTTAYRRILAGTGIAACFAGVCWLTL